MIMKAFLSIATALLPFVLGVVVAQNNLTQQISDNFAVTDIPNPQSPLGRTNVALGMAVKPGTQLRILCVGDSITWGFMSDKDGGDGNGYRLKLRENLSKDKIVFAGTETSNGNMADGYFAAWNGKTIQFIADHVKPSLKQRPNIILLHAGTNDMNPNSFISTEGHDPKEAALRLDRLIDMMITECPDAVILVAMILDTCNADQAPQTERFQTYISQVASAHLKSGAHILAVDFTTFRMGNLQDCIHPTNNGYHLMADYWYDFITQIPKDWINAPVGPNPKRSETSGDGKVSGVNLFLLGLTLVFVFTPLYG